MSAKSAESAEPAEPARLLYVHDPMCAWCWGFSRNYRRLTDALPASVPVVRLLGGLAPDSSEAMPPAMRRHLQKTWKTIEATVPGARFNHDFWTHCQPRRSTWPACRAVIAARLQSPDHDLAMTAAIQQGYYLHAKNPSDDATLIEFAAELGLDTREFSHDLNAAAVQQQLEREIALARRLGVQGFPSLLLLNGDATRGVRVNYTDAGAMLEEMMAPAGAHKPPSAVATKAVE